LVFAAKVRVDTRILLDRPGWAYDYLKKINLSHCVAYERLSKEFRGETKSKL